jgi:autotransporter-associated beta strand protein
MRRFWLVWSGYVLSLATVVAAMGWVSLAAVRLDRGAALEEKVRLALWRADSAVAPLVAQESVLPWFVYRSFFPADRAYNRLLNNDHGGSQMLVPSPLLTATNLDAAPDVAPKVLVHFQFEPDGRLTSPQVPEDSNYKLAVPKQVTPEYVEEAKKQLREVKSLVDREKLLALLPERTPEAVEVVMSVPPVSPTEQQATKSQSEQNRNQQGAPQQTVTQQYGSQWPMAQSDEQRKQQRNRRADIQRDNGQGLVEYNVRQDLLRNPSSVFLANNSANTYSGQTTINGGLLQSNGLTLPLTDVMGVPMKPLWIEGRLILARRVAAGGAEYVQGCLLDWPAIKAAIFDTIVDLLPNADFEPVVGDPGPNEAHMLAALPVRIIPGSLPASKDATLAPLLTALAVAWGCMMLAAVAIAGLLAGVMRLGERRASFVTAVTHELRTPLTTFQMYAEMLAEGMVPENQQRPYLSTLRAESVRLTHMVENVLSYARLERGRADGRLESVSLGRLVDGTKDRLAARAEQAGMSLAVEVDDLAQSAMVQANVSAVEQILFNLVDNACKYAGDAADKRIHLQARLCHGSAVLCVCDHGPGLLPPARRRLFRSFSKTAREAAHSAPGVGLGLALSRRLARHMGGELRLERNCPEGACFVLSLSREE